MARDYDSQLLESVAVRRRRMRDALLFGAQRGRRTADERLGKVFAGIAIAAVLCAGCVGWSFLQDTLEKQKAEKKKQDSSRNSSTTRPGRASRPRPPAARRRRRQGRGRAAVNRAGDGKGTQGSSWGWACARQW